MPPPLVDRIKTKVQRGKDKLRSSNAAKSTNQKEASDSDPTARISDFKKTQPLQDTANEDSLGQFLVSPVVEPANPSAGSIAEVPISDSTSGLDGLAADAPLEAIPSVIPAIPLINPSPEMQENAPPKEAPDSSASSKPAVRQTCFEISVSSLSKDELKHFNAILLNSETTTPNSKSQHLEKYVQQLSPGDDEQSAEKLLAQKKIRYRMTRLKQFQLLVRSVKPIATAVAKIDPHGAAPWVVAGVFGVLEVSQMLHQYMPSGVEIRDALLIV